MSVESILSAYLKEHDNPEQYAILSAFVRDCAVGADDETLWLKYDGKIDRETGEFLKKQIGK